MGKKDVTSPPHIAAAAPDGLFEHPAGLDILGFHPGKDAAEMHGKGAAGDIRNVAFERIMDHGKGQVVPGNVAQGKQLHVEALGAGFEVWGAHRSAEDHMNLADARQAQHRMQRRDLHVSMGFFHGFANRGLLRALPDFHKACGKGPMAEARFDGPPAEQDFAFPLGNAAGDDFWIDVMDGLTGIAHKSRQVIAGGNF